MTRFLAAVLLGMTAAGAAVADNETWAGLPASSRPVEVLRNPGFLVGYSEERHQPLWVAYRAETLKGTPALPPRPRFEADKRTTSGISYFDYRGSHYTRGHLAPNYLIGKLYGAEAQKATFLMSNVSPQTARLNELVWQRLEEAESDRVAPSAVQLWVLAGPLFSAQPARLKRGIAVPEAFYRIWLDLRDGAPAALAFIVPQDVCGTEPLSKFVTSIDEIERRTGLDFCAELDDTREAALESARSTEGWQPGRWENRKPRYAENFGELECPAA